MRDSVEEATESALRLLATEIASGAVAVKGAAAMLEDAVLFRMAAAGTFVAVDCSVRAVFASGGEYSDGPLDVIVMWPAESPETFSECPGDQPVRSILPSRRALPGRLPLGARVVLF